MQCSLLGSGSGSGVRRLDCCSRATVSFTATSHTTRNRNRAAVWRQTGRTERKETFPPIEGIAVLFFKHRNCPLLLLNGRLWLTCLRLHRAVLLVYVASYASPFLAPGLPPAVPLHAAFLAGSPLAATAAEVPAAAEEARRLRSQGSRRRRKKKKVRETTRLRHRHQQHAAVTCCHNTLRLN
jgi:hypothetical protein